MKITANQSSANKVEAHNENRTRLVFLLRRYSRWVMVAEVVLILVAGYWFFVSAGVNNIRRGHEETIVAERETQARLAAIDQETAKLAELVSRYESLSDGEIAAIKDFLPDESYLDELFVQLEAAASSNGLLLTAVSIAADTDANAASSRRRLDIAERAPAQNQPTDKVVSTAVTLKISGAGYPALKNFLNSLERNRRLINVTQVNYDPGRAAAELTALVYHLAP